MSDENVGQSTDQIDSKYQALEQKLKESQDRISKSEATAKDLSVRLTKAQQEMAELYRFHKATLPKINKSFAEDWDDNPEEAVVKRVQNKMEPIEKKTQEIGTEIGKLKAKVAFQSVLAKHPGWAKYADRAIELGNEEEYWELTWKGEKGIMALFRLAGADEKQVEKEEGRQEGETQVKVTEKVYSEDSSAKTVSGNGKVKLNPDEMLIAKKLGIKPEDYFKHKQMGAE